MITIIPQETATKDLHEYMLSSIAPRPIAFASTIAADGTPNLAPYSFFNCFSSNPPILIFSSNRRVRNNTTKDTLSNIEQIPEVVINVVSYRFVRQMALASVEYASEINEFEKAGFSSIPAQTVRPFRVAESAVQYECKVKEVIKLGNNGGAGNLIVAEVQCIHIDSSILNEHQKIDFNKIDLCGRMGANYYVRASGAAVFELHQPVNVIGIGFDNLPSNIKTSKILTGNELALLAAVEKLPSDNEIENFKQLHPEFSNLSSENKHLQAQNFLLQFKTHEAWCLLLT